MGAAAYQRGSNVISSQIERDIPKRPIAFLIMDKINALPKANALMSERRTPFGETVVIEKDKFRDNCWWMMDPEKLHDGFSLCYKSLEACISAWDIYLTEYDEILERWTATW